MLQVRIEQQLHDGGSEERESEDDVDIGDFGDMEQIQVETGARN
jgi:hypothetical protein